MSTRMSFSYNGIELSVDDFPRDLRGWVAYSIAFAATTKCRDTEAALELLLYEADKIIEQVQAGKVPEC